MCRPPAMTVSRSARNIGAHLFDSWSFISDSEPVEAFAQEHRPAPTAGRLEISHIAEVAVDTATWLEGE
jgi:hypothetical protein